MCCCCCNIFSCFPNRYGLSNCCIFFRSHLLYHHEETAVGFLRDKQDFKCHEPFLSDVEVAASAVTVSSTLKENIEFTNKKNIFSVTHKLPIISSDKVENIRNECVICLDEFSADNPPMLTLCACGENRTSFHYHCLLLWLQRKTSCPNCARRLYYQVNLHKILVIII